MENQLECTNGWIKIKRTIDNDKESVVFTTNIDDDAEMSLTFYYDCESKADTAFENLSKSNSDELRNKVLQILGF